MSRSGTFLLSSVFLQEIIFSVKFFARVWAKRKRHQGDIFVQGMGKYNKLRLFELGATKQQRQLSLDFLLDKRSFLRQAWRKTYTAKEPESGSRIRIMPGSLQRFSLSPRLLTIPSSSSSLTNAERFFISFLVLVHYSPFLSGNCYQYHRKRD